MGVLGRGGGVRGENRERRGSEAEKGIRGWSGGWGGVGREEGQRQKSA